MTMPKTVGTGCGVSGAPTEEMSLFQVDSILPDFGRIFFTK